MHEETSILKLILDSNLINFALAFALIAFFLMRTIPKASQQRKVELENEIAAAEKAKNNAETKLKELQSEIERSKIEAQTIINTAKNTAASIKEQAISEAKIEVQRLSENAVREIDLQKTLAINNIKKEITQKAFEITERNIRNKKDEINQLIQSKVKQELGGIK